MYKKVCILSGKKQRDEQSSRRIREHTHHGHAPNPPEFCQSASGWHVAGRAASSFSILVSSISRDLFGSIVFIEAAAIRNWPAQKLLCEPGWSNPRFIAPSLIWNNQKLFSPENICLPRMKLRIRIIGPKVHDVGYRYFLMSMAMANGIRRFEAHNIERCTEKEVLVLVDGGE